MSQYADYYYQTQDNLKLYARDYNVSPSKFTLLCMHGLTRNSADFEGLSQALSPNYRLVVVDQRGRGKSQWDIDPRNYVPAIYVHDMFQLIDELRLKNVILVGTSLGGIMAMMMNAMRPSQFNGVILNDVGPVFDSTGLNRIKSYTGKQTPVKSWEEAIDNTRAINEVAFPNQSTDFWHRFARRIYADSPEGNPVLLYDPDIAIPFSESGAQDSNMDLWPIFKLLNDIPVLAIRGELSDLLSEVTLKEMKRRKADLKATEIKGVGHAPLLSEPDAIESIKSFLAELS